MGSKHELLAPAQKSGPRFLNPVPTQIGGFRMMLRVLPLYFTNREERTPKIAPGPFVTDPAIYQTPPSSGLRVTWFGHSAMLLELDGLRVLIDPVWEQRASPWQRFGPKRFFAPTMHLDDLPPLDAVLLSHDHYDHLGAHTMRQLARLPVTHTATWLTSLGVGRYLRRWGVPAARVREFDWMDGAALRSERSGATLTVTAVPARHFSGRSLGNRFRTLWSAFVLAGAQHRVYYGADTGCWDGFGEIARRFGPFDLTMLEIGAFNELWKEIHLGPDGAAEAFAAMGGRGLLMPIHWGLFDLALHAWRQPIERLEQLARERGLPLWSPKPGLPTEVVRGKPLLDGWWRKPGRQALPPG